MLDSISLLSLPLFLPLLSVYSSLLLFVSFLPSLCVHTHVYIPLPHWHEQEMDEELRGERQKQSKLTKRMEELQSDNLRLYEKVKFLEGYRPKGQADSTRDVEDRYGQLYSQSMNPFQAFNKAQEKEREKQLNPIERMLLMMSQFFLSNKQARIFLFVYMVILHLIVSLTLQHFASVKHDHC
mmetsp:Transcript_37897/g.97831  ORF Transcript_37897/g.97831 Transcript_37897/m.97831 type:complete len:182 (-) Transcript_37897:183-728(-)